MYSNLEVVLSFFERNNIDINNLPRVKNVSMDNYEITDNRKDMLFTRGLATCTALVAIADNFAFLAHIDNGPFSRNSFGNSVRQNQDETEHSTVKTCKMVEQLLLEIYQRRNEITPPIHIQLVIGGMPLPAEDIHRKLTEDGICRLINICNNNLGINAVRVPNGRATAVLVNSETKEIILDESFDKAGIERLLHIKGAASPNVKDVERE